MFTFIFTAKFFCYFNSQYILILIRLDFEAFLDKFYRARFQNAVDSEIFMDLFLYFIHTKLVITAEKPSVSHLL